MAPPDFNRYVDVLRQRLFDHEAIHGGNTAPDFDELMSDYADVGAPKAWTQQAYEELLAQGHLDPKVSGVTMGPTPDGLLSADGRHYVRQQPQDD